MEHQDAKQGPARIHKNTQIGRFNLVPTAAFFDAQGVVARRQSRQNQEKSQVDKAGGWLALGGSAPGVSGETCAN